MGQVSTDHFQTQFLAAAEMMKLKRFAEAEASLRQLLAATFPAVQDEPLRAGGRVIAVLSALFALQLTQGRREDADETALVVKEAAWAADDFAATGDMTWWHALTPGILGADRCGAGIRSPARIEPVAAGRRIA